MKRMALLLAVLLCCLSLGAAEESGSFVLHPFNPEDPWIDSSNGVFRCSVENPETAAADGVLVLDLYLEDRYNGDVIGAFSPGDRVNINGTDLTVRECVLRWTDSALGYEYELYTEEDAFDYIVFRPMSNGSCTVLVDDWSPVFWAGRIEICLPLTNRFRYVSSDTHAAGESAEEYALLRDLAENGDSFVPYNTSCVIVGGELWELVHTPYPEGPGMP